MQAGVIRRLFGWLRGLKLNRQRLAESIGIGLRGHVARICDVSHVCVKSMLGMPTDIPIMKSKPMNVDARPLTLRTTLGVLAAQVGSPKRGSLQETRNED